jgi:hypothetical protein
MKKIALVLGITFFAFYVFSADGEKVQTKGEATGTVVRTWQAGKDYTYEQKSDFEKSIRDQMKKLDAQMDKVHSASQEQLDRIKEQRDQLSKKLNEISASSKDAWGDLEHGINSAFDDLRTSVKKAKDKFK